MKALILILILASGVVRATTPDIKPRPRAKGGASLGVKTGESVPVAMTSERVDIYPSARGVRIQVSFQLENLSDRDSRFEVGFPSYFEATLRNFAASVDGQRQLFELVRTEKKGRRKPIFVYWLCWKMEFLPKQKRKVVVSYVVDTHHFTLSGSDQHLPRHIRERLYWHRSGYVLQTGADWAGPIGRAEIYLHHSNDVPRERCNILTPKGDWNYDAKQNATVCVLENFEPDHRSDVRFEFRSMPPAEEIALLESVLKEQRLRPGAWHRLMQLVESSLPDAKARDAKLLAIARKVLPPRAGKPNWKRFMLSRDRAAWRHGFRRYVEILHRQPTRSEEFTAAASEQRKMLEAFLARARSGRRAELEAELRELERQLARH